MLVGSQVKRLIIGCGYLGKRVANAWRQQGDDVWALTRSTSHAAEIAQVGIMPILGDVLDVSSLVDLPTADTVLYAVGYDRKAPASKRTVYVDGLRNALDRLPTACGRLLYISSTSVYGQSEGEWVDETSPCEPATEGGRICLDAEQVAHRSDRVDEVSILRLTGIYGPGRLAARVRTLREGQPIAADPDGWLNLIHVDDACRAVLRCSELPKVIETLLVTDNEPLQRRSYYEELARELRAPAPVFQSAVSGELGKRCSNKRLRSIPGMSFRYPTIRDGLPTTLDAGGTP